MAIVINNFRNLWCDMILIMCTIRLLELRWLCKPARRLNFNLPYIEEGNVVRVAYLQQPFILHLLRGTFFLLQQT